MHGQTTTVTLKTGVMMLKIQLCHHRNKLHFAESLIRIFRLCHRQTTTGKLKVENTAMLINFDFLINVECLFQTKLKTL